jgi:diacylglycerol kinase (ATP)
MKSTQETQEQKSRRGLSRIWHALGFSIEGLRAGWLETAFRQESVLALFLIPSALVLGHDWVEVSLLIGSVLLVMIVELLNTAVESAIDRVSADWHALSKRAKDLGSAAVLLALMLCVGVWLSALWHASFWGPLKLTLGL